MGQATAMMALAAVTYLFIEGPGLGWTSPSALLSGVIAVIAGVAFYWIERTGVHPMLPLEFFKIRAFTVSTVLGFGLNFAFYGQLFFLNVYYQQQHGLSPQATGLRFLPQAIAAVTFAYTAGQLAHRLHPARAFAIGCGLGALGLFGLHQFGLHGNVWVDSLCMAAIGVSIGTPASLIAIMLGSVPTDRSGLAGGAINAARQTGGLLGVAVLGAIVGHASNSGIHLALLISASVLGAAALGAAALAYTNQTAREVDLAEAIAEAI
jgi:DHA2 family methylenomycin A resistance protein-like MFS transporter